LLHGVIALSICAIFFCSLSRAQSAGPAPRLSQTIDEKSLVTLKGNVHPLARSTNDQGAAPDDLRLERMLLLLKPSDAQQSALRELLEAQQTKSSPQYHKWLTPAEYGAQFGVAQQDIDTITGWLQSHGFTIESVSRSRNLITLTGTNAQLRSAFHTTIHSYKVKNEQHYANASNPQVPAALAPAISGIVALNNFSIKPTHVNAGLFSLDKSTGKWIKAQQTQTGTITRVTATGNQTLPAVGPHDFATAPQATTSNPVYHGVGPYDFATIYNVISLWNAGYDGTGQTIAIVGRSDIHTADVNSFRSAFGLPAANLNIIYDGPNPGVTSAEDESDLDVEWSGAVAKGATIDYVVAGTTATTDGIDLSAQYIVDNNLAPVMSISYGKCEVGMGTAENQFYSSLWQQAAAQGITVFASAGDAGSATCDNENKVEDSVYGLAVSGIASTPYDVAVGGTDFSGNYNALSTYWSATNTPTTLQSVKSYIPETPWNDSCGNPLILSIIGPQIGVTTGEELCNSIPAEDEGLIEIVGGGGGQSGYGGTNGLIDYGWEDLPALPGYAKPAWQAGVPGIPADGVRDLPDVSLFAGNGFWGSFYIFCDTDATSTGSCDFTNGGQVLGAGGTSFAAPSFAGILAIVNQYQAKQGQSASQGNANYVLYKLAANEYNNASTLASCNSSSVASGNSCVFYDIAQGSNVVPCGFPSPYSPGCTITNPNDELGLLNGYTANAGYDLASGLGSVNAYNLATNWNSASSTFLASRTTLTPSSSSGVYGTPLQVSVSVAATSGEGGTPGGSTSVILGGAALTNGFTGGPFTLNGSGQASGQINGLPAGSDTLLATYGGDVIFGGSTSAGVPVTIAQAQTTSSFTASRSSLAAGDSVTFFLTIETQSTANSPTGSVVFTDSTNGATLGTVAVQPAIDAAGNSIATASFNVLASGLTSGVNSVTAAYSGDSNYTGSASTAILLTNTGGFTVSINPSSLALSANGSGTATVTITPTSGALITAVQLACAPASLPAGMTCSFSPATIPAGSLAATSTLTLQTAAPLAVKSQSAAPPQLQRLPWLGAGAISLAGIILIFLPGRRRYFSRVLGLALAVAAVQVLGCGGSGHSAVGIATGSTTGIGAQVIGTTTTLASSGTSALLGTAVTFTTNVAPQSSIGTPTGTVTFLDGSTTLGTAVLEAGSATWSTSALSLGTHSITVRYGGDTNFSASTSPALTENILYSTTLSVTGTDGSGNSGAATLQVTVQ
jgi:hypothetical protein